MGGLLLLITVMLLTLLCHFAQMAVWAALFMFLGGFSDFATALYHSKPRFQEATGEDECLKRSQLSRLQKARYRAL
jgi:hypothetical protein